MMCDKGVLTLSQGTLRLYTREGGEPEVLFGQPAMDTRIPLLCNVIRAFTHGSPCESGIEDYLHSFLFSMGAIRAAETGERISIKEMYSL